MLRIRSSQDSILSEIFMRNFIVDMLGSVNEVWPDLCERLGKERLELAIIKTIDCAIQNGFKSERDVEMFLHLAFAFEALDFVTQPWAKQIIEKINLAPGHRMDELFDAGVGRIELQEQEGTHDE